MIQTIFFLFSFLIHIHNSFGWGATGHTLITSVAMKSTSDELLKNCKTTREEIIAHTNDPDEVWKTQRLKHPHEPSAHYFHLDQAPSNWKELSNSTDQKNGFLVYRIADYFEKAKLAKKNQNYDELKQYLYGLSHYLGDLSQPLHVHHDHDGKDKGINGIHSQFETKMINRYKDDLNKLVSNSAAQNISEQLWTNFQYKELIFKLAEQNSSKADILLNKAKAVVENNSASKSIKKKNKPSLVFVKSKLWDQLKELTIEQMSQSAVLIHYTFGLICR